MQTNVLIIYVVLICTATSKKLPANFKICDYFAPDLNDCLKVAIQSALIQLANGLPEIDAAPMQPVVIPSASIDKGHHILSLYNLKTYNLIDATVHSVNATATPKTFSAKIVLTAKEVIGRGDYSLNGTVLVLSLDSSGEGVIIFRDTTITTTIMGDAVETNGNLHYQLYNFTMDINPKIVSFQFENVIKGNEELNNALNKVLNENWEMLFGDGKEELAEIYNSYFKPYANNILKYVPITMK